MTGERTPPRRWVIPAALRPFGVIAALAVVQILALALGWGGDASASWLAAWAAGLAATSLLYAAGRAPRTPTGRVDRDIWRWFGAAALAWCAGATINAISRFVISRAVVAVSPADLFFLIAPIALAAGFVLPLRLPRSTRPWLRYLADTYVCACALFVVGWVLIFDRMYHVSGEGWAQFFIELRYPLLYAVLVSALLPMALRAGRGRRRPVAVAYCALLLFMAADVSYAALRLNDEGAHGVAADLTRIAGLLLLGAVPWVVRGGRPAGEAPLARQGALSDEARSSLLHPGIAPAAAAAAAAAVFVAGHTLTADGGLRPIVTILAGSAVLVTLARLGELVRDNGRLRDAVDRGEEHFRALAESINDVVLICGVDGVVQYVSAGARRSYHYSAEDLLGHPVYDIVHPEDLPRVLAAVATLIGPQLDQETDQAARRAGRAAGDDTVPASSPDSASDSGPDSGAGGAGLPCDGPDGDGVVRVACRVRAMDGTWLPTESTISRYGRGGDGCTDRLLVTTRDFSEQAALQRQVTHLTFHDGLTGLPNRAYLEERAREVVGRSQGTAAVIFVDLDGFTAVNDSIGHAGGDQVLSQAARRIRSGVLADDTVARWGGDEFAVLMQNVADAQTVVDLCERLLRALAGEPYRVADRSIVLTASVGIAFEEDDVDGPELIRNADIALSRAKELGGGRAEVFAAKMHADVMRRLELGGDLQRALTEHEFAVEYQPVVELSTSRVTGVEALVRWCRDGAFVPPKEFIGTAEESGLLVPLGNWVLNEACAQVAHWRSAGWDIGLSINLRPREIAAPQFVDSVAVALSESGLPPEMLTLEVEEEVLVDGAEELIARLSALRDLGVRLAIDDFGTGYASLAYLRQLPVDVIKIDPSFVSGLGRDETLTLLTRTIARVGRDLGLTVVAEGVERPEQLELLREMECPRVQGFLISHPMTPSGIESLVRVNSRGEASVPLRGSVISAS